MAEELGASKAQVGYITTTGASVRNDYAKDSKLTDAQREEKAARELAERNRLSRDEGKICFDLFADLAGQILHGSRRIRKLIGEAYPFVILDEFQDTDADQWTVVRALGQEPDRDSLHDRRHLHTLCVMV